MCSTRITYSQWNILLTELIFIMKVLLVSLAIGDKYINEYNELFYKSQYQYCQKHGYDFKLITKRLIGSINHPDNISFDKALMFSQPWSEEYDWVVFIDADILISPIAPAIHKHFLNKEKVYVADEYSQPNTEARIAVQKKMGWETSAQDYYQLAGFSIETKKMINTGIIGCCPEINGKFMKSIHFKHSIRSLGHPRHFHFEQSAIGYELQKENKDEYLDNRFNAVWNIHKLHDSKIQLDNFVNVNYFIHFAGKVDFDLIPHLNTKFKL